MNFNRTGKSTQSLNKIGYQFTAVPTKLMFLCDVNVRSALFGLIQLSREFAADDGWFFRTNEDLQIDMKLSQHLVVATIDSLYRKGIVYVRPQSKGNRGIKTPPNYYKINYDKFREYERIDFNTLRNPDLLIETMKYKEKGYRPQYIVDAETNETLTYSTPTEKVPTNKEIIDIKNNIYEHNNTAEIQGADIKDSTPIAISLDRVNENINASAVQSLLGYESKGQRFQEKNTAITNLFRRIEDEIKLFKDSRIEIRAKEYADMISKSLQWGYEHKDYFTLKQWNMFIKKETSFKKLLENKDAYFQRGRKRQVKKQFQSEAIISGTSGSKECINQLQPNSISEDFVGLSDSSESMSWDDKFWNDITEMEQFNQSVIDEFPLNSGTLRYEDMKGEERDYFNKSIFELTSKGELLRFIRACKWLRNKNDAERLFETFHQRVIDYVGLDVEAQNQWISMWEKECEQVA